MPGTYDADTRTITLTSQWDGTQSLSVATVINFVVVDLLTQSEFPGTHLPEIVDLAVIATGLGVPRCQIDLVSKSGTFWDTTAWEVLPPPFVGAQKAAYALAMVSWVRQEKSPPWKDELTTEIAGPMNKSLKHLFKTGDSFFPGPEKPIANFSQQQWLQLANETTVSSQIIGLRHCINAPENSDAHWQSQWADVLIENFRSNNNDLILHSIAAVERGRIEDPRIGDELVVLAEHRADRVKAKAIIALTRIGKLDSTGMEMAAKMLDSREKFVIFAGVLALSSTDEVPEQALPSLDRALARSLANCDQEFINLFASGYRQWVADPAEHFRGLFEADSPEYLEIALDALEGVGEQFVSIE